MTPTENAAEKTLREANEFLEKNGLTEIVDQFFQDPEVTAAIKISYAFITGHLNHLNQTAPKALSGTSEKFVKTFREVENEERYASDVKENFIRSLNRSNENFGEILKMMEASEFEEKFPALLKETFESDTGKKILLLDIKRIITNMQANVFTEYFTECITKCTEVFSEGKVIHANFASKDTVSSNDDVDDDYAGEEP